MRRRVGDVRVEKQNLSASERCQKATIRLDLYKQPFKLLLPDEKDEYRTFTGAVLTICSIFVILIYAGFKISTLLSYTDYKVQIRSFEEHYTDLDRFNATHGLAIAAGVALDPGETIPRSYGSLQFYRRQWREDGFERMIPLQTRQCQLSDFNLGSFQITTPIAQPDNNDPAQQPNPDKDQPKTADQISFYQTRKNQNFISYYLEHLRCVADPNELYISGNSQTRNGDTLMVVFEKCSPYKTPDIICAGERDIDSWLAGQRILTVDNQKRLIQRKQTAESEIISSAETRWYQVDPSYRTENVMMITRSAMESNDALLGFGRAQQPGHYIENQPWRVMHFENTFVYAITYEISLDEKHYHYFHSGVLDFLALLGGFIFTFSRLSFFMVAILHSFGSLQFAMADNFYYKSEDGQDENGKPFRNSFQWDVLKSIKLNAHTFWPKKLLKCCLCCRPDQAERRRAKGYDYFLQEASISHIIQQLRVLNAACKESRTAEEWKALEQENALLAFEDLAVDDIAIGVSGRDSSDSEKSAQKDSNSKNRIQPYFQMQPLPVNESGQGLTQVEPMENTQNNLGSDIPARPPTGDSSYLIQQSNHRSIKELPCPRSQSVDFTTTKTTAKILAATNAFQTKDEPPNDENDDGHSFTLPQIASQNKTSIDDYAT